MTVVLVGRFKDAFRGHAEIAVCGLRIRGIATGKVYHQGKEEDHHGHSHYGMVGEFPLASGLWRG